jgi:hypothetical protein
VGGGTIGVTTGDPGADRAMAAIPPFVIRWGIPSQPEDVEEIVSAVLRHADSDSNLEEIDAAVPQPIAEYMLRMRRFQLEACRKPERLRLWSRRSSSCSSRRTTKRSGALPRIPAAGFGLR